MRIAIPVAEGRLCPHFGHCKEFVIFEAQPDTKTIVSRSSAIPPPHEPGVLPRWLRAQGADVVVTGGMGARAQQLLESYGVEVVTGAVPGPAAEVARAYLTGTLALGPDPCDHGEGGGLPQRGR